MELNKITDVFTQLRKNLTVREENFRKEYLARIDQEFGYFRDDLRLISRIHTAVEQLFCDMNQITIVLDHMEPSGVVAQTQRVRDFADRFEHLKSALIDQHPADGDVGPDGIHGVGSGYRGATSALNLLPIVVLNQTAAMRFIDNIGKVAKDPDQARNLELQWQEQRVPIFDANTEARLAGD